MKQNMSIGDTIREYRNKLKLTQKAFAEKAGVSLSALQRYESGERTPPIAIIKKIANALDVDYWEIIGFNTVAVPFDEMLPANIKPMPSTHMIPLVGSIACGTPITAEENIDGYVPVTDDLQCQFALQCKGDSMSPRVMDGDLVYIRQQPDVEDGQIAAVVIDGEATLKHVYHIQDGVQLVSDNPAYRPMIFNGANSDELRILGLAVAYQRML